MDNKSIAHTRWNCTYHIYPEISTKDNVRGNKEPLSGEATSTPPQTEPGKCPRGAKTKPPFEMWVANFVS